MEKIKFRDLNIKQYFSDPYRFVTENLESTEDGIKEIIFYPYVENSFSFKEEFKIQVNCINFSDYVILKTAIDLIPSDPEIGDFFIQNFNSLEEMNEMTIPVADAGEYISSKETIFGNCYNSNTDTYGTMMGNKAYNLYFLYIKDISEYIVVQQSYYVL
ncbi:hypothetical protein ABE151_17365 [Bacillus paralicheniformis]|uniref:hypothetical protein n=1 Tax=Bacillus paralicheniformis TaxID=1648923 RepID=UPI003D1981EB